MTLKVKYQNGVLKLLEKAELTEEALYEIEIKDRKKTEIRYISADKIDQLCGIASIGGNAVEDSEKLYE